MKKIKKQIKNWVKEFIIGLNLCPFAKKPWQLGRVKIKIVESAIEEELTRVLLEELSALVNAKRNDLETTLLVSLNLFSTFEDFLVYLNWTEDLLKEIKVEGLIQVVGFHPDYYFEGVSKEDYGNFTNRSPYPVLHLIREESIDEAVRSYPDVEEIPKRNVELLRKMKLEDLKKYVDGKNDAKRA